MDSKITYKYKKAYLGEIFDKKIIKSTKKYYSYSNYREKVFCKCGHDFEIKINYVNDNFYVDRNGNLKTNEDNSFLVYGEGKITPHIFCEKCKTKYKNIKDFVKLRSLNSNSKDIKYRCYENETTITLYCYIKYIGISLTTKKLFSITQKELISFNKEKKSFYLIKTNDKTIKRLGVRFLYKHLYEFIAAKNGHISMVYKSDKIAIQKNIIKDICEFTEKISKYVNEKDVNKIKKNYNYNLENSLNNNYNLENSLNNSINLLSIYISLIYYSHFSTIIFSKGISFYIDFLRKGFVFPPLTTLKIKKPTNPTSILEHILKKQLKRLNKNNIGYYNNIDNLCRTFKIKEINNIKLTKHTLCLIESYEDLVHLYISLYFIKLKNNEITSFLMKYNYKLIKSISIQIINNNLNEYICSIDIVKIKHLLKMLENTNPLFFSLSLYLDVIRMMNIIGIEGSKIFNYKTWEELNNFHNDLIIRFREIKLNNLNEKIAIVSKKFKNMERTINKIDFNIIDNIQCLEKESQEMNHCVRSYAHSISDNKCVIFKVTDKETGDRATLELKIEEINHENESLYTRLFFSQLKSKNNTRASEKIINTTIEFCEKVANAKIYDFHKNTGDLLLKNDLEINNIVNNNIVGNVF